MSRPIDTRGANTVEKVEVHPRSSGSLTHVTYANGFVLSISTGNGSVSCERFGVLLTVEVGVWDAADDPKLCQLCKSDTVAQLGIEEYELLTDTMLGLPEDNDEARQALRYYADRLRSEGGEA